MNTFGKYNEFKKNRNRRIANNSKRQMLDMRRERYFRLDLDELLVGLKLEENKNTVAATVLNKMISHSMDDALEYIERIKTAGTISGEGEERLKALLYKYSKWR